MTLHDPRPDAALLAAIAGRAADADAGARDLSADVAALRDAGFLDRLVAACGPGGDATAAVGMLRALGRASLPVGRLAEGHVNAAILLALYGTPDQRRRHAGRFLGVWGAEGSPPCRIDGDVLRGQKRFCSGAGIVEVAVLTAPASDADPAPQLLLAEVTDPARHGGDWDVSGMRATASVAVDLDGLPFERLGAPGDQTREPQFEGGVWRYMALHAGGLEALAEAVRAQVRARATDLNLARLADMAIATHAARMWTEAAARAALAPGAGAEVVPEVLLAREAVERACVEGMAITERAMGTAAHRAGDVDRIRRDLGFFLRQADLDGKLMRAARGLCDGPRGAPWNRS